MNSSSLVSTPSRLCDLRQIHTLSDPQFLLVKWDDEADLTGSLGGPDVVTHTEYPSVLGIE